MVTGEIMENDGIHIAPQKNVALQISRLLHNNTSSFPNGGVQSIGALPGDPRSTLWKTPLIFPALIGFEVKLEYLQTQVFGSHTTITTVLQAFSSGLAIKDPHQSMHNTLEAARRSWTKGVRWPKEARFTWSGLSRSKQFIEVFGYCVLGAHVNVRSRRTRDAQAEFLTLMEDAIRELDLPQIKSADAWLVLSKMVRDISSTVGNNN